VVAGSACLLTCSRPSPGSTTAKALEDAAKATLAKWHRAQDVGWRSSTPRLRQHRAKGPGVEKFKAMICSEGVPALRLHTQGGDFLEATHFLERGDPNQKQGVATQSFLQVLMRHPRRPRSTGSSRRRRTRAARTAARSLTNWMRDVEDGRGTCWRA